MNGSILPDSVLMSKLMGEKKIPNFDFFEKKNPEKWVGTVAGIKNSGKTINSINLYDSVLLIDFDGNGTESKKTLVSKHIMKEEDIFVLDAKKYLSDKPTPNEYMLNYFYIKEACRKFQEKYSGVVIDTLDGLEEMLVEKARYLYGSNKTGLTPTYSLTWQGWADRTSTLNELWNLFLKTAKVGVTYIADYRFFDRAEENKSITVKVPKWFDIIRRESKYLVEIDQFPNFDTQQVTVTAKVWMSKDEQLMKPASKVDITGYKPVIDKTLFKEYCTKKSTINNISNKIPSDQEPQGKPGAINWS
jgi:hypothetical protein